ncbi:MAG: hypothetical protein K0S56_345 [Microvirga sp.]|jgi:hypothetical protein|nr:hypothetical protein [Microvirga sp.]
MTLGPLRNRCGQHKSVTKTPANLAAAGVYR